MLRVAIGMLGWRSTAKASEMTCLAAHVSFWAPRSFAFNGVSNSDNCRKLCQLMSPPIEFLGTEIGDRCYSNFQCRGSSFNSVTGRCELFESDRETVFANFVESTSIHCHRPRVFNQRRSKIRCLEISDAAALSQYDIQEDIVNHTISSSFDRMDQHLPNSIAPMLPIRAGITFDFLSTHLEEVAAEQGWLLRTNLQSNFGYDNVPNKIWGVPRNVSDWRYCYLLCRKYEECRRWTFIATRETYNLHRGGCYLKTGLAPVAPITDESMISISGNPAMSREDEYIYFGTSLTSSPTVQSAMESYNLAEGSATFSGSMLSCIQRGEVAWQADGLIVSPLIHAEYEALTLVSCWLACSMTENCEAIQFTPPEFAAMAPNLFYNGVGCLLFRAVSQTLSVFPFTTTIQSSATCPLLQASPDSTICPPEADVTEPREDDLGDGVAVRGDLLAAGNYFLSSAVGTCQSVCRRLDGCVAFTWAPAQEICYLFESVRDFRRDGLGQMISGWKDPSRNVGTNWTRIRVGGPDYVLISSKGGQIRSVVTCSHFEIDTNRSSPSTVRVPDVHYAQNCFEQCRRLVSCVSFSWNTVTRNCFLQITSTWRHSVEVAAGTMISAQAQCDAIGELTLYVEMADEFVLPLIITASALALLGGSAVAACMVVMVRRKKFEDIDRI